MRWPVRRSRRAGSTSVSAPDRFAVSTNELQAAHAMVDTIDLALAEAVRDFEKKCAKVP